MNCVRRREIWWMYSVSIPVWGPKRSFRVLKAVTASFAGRFKGPDHIIRKVIAGLLQEAGNRFRYFFCLNFSHGTPFI